MEQSLVVVGIEMASGVEGIGGAGKVSGALKGDAEKEARTALAGQEFHRFSERGGGGSGIFFKQENAQIQMGFGHFRIKGYGPLVFGASLVVLMESGVGVGELEVGKGDVRLLGEEFLERRDSGVEIVFVESGLGFIEEVIERIADFLWFTLGLLSSRRVGHRQQERDEHHCLQCK